MELISIYSFLYFPLITTFVLKNSLQKVCGYTNGYYCLIGNIANYLELSEVVSLYIPVPVNFIFLGFDGQGNHGKSLVFFCFLI